MKPTRTYFQPSMTADEMKKAYRKLSLIWHPDINKAPEANDTMKQINVDFAYWYSRAATEQVKEEKKRDKPQNAEYYDNRYDRTFIQNLEDMIKWIYENNIDRMAGLEVDIVGVFIWIAGIKADNVDARMKVKSVGFQGAWKYHDDQSKEYMWKWTPEIKRFAANPNIDDIKRRYGSESVKRGINRKQLT